MGLLECCGSNMLHVTLKAGIFADGLVSDSFSKFSTTALHNPFK